MWLDGSPLFSRAVVRDISSLSSSHFLFPAAQGTPQAVWVKVGRSEQAANVPKRQIIFVLAIPLHTHDLAGYAGPQGIGP